METNQIIAAIDDQIAKLQQVKSLLGGTQAGRKPGRPKGSGTPKLKRRKGMSEAGRKAVAEAQRKRWAAIRAGKSAKK